MKDSVAALSSPVVSQWETRLKASLSGETHWLLVSSFPLDYDLLLIVALWMDVGGYTLGTETTSADFQIDGR